MSLTGYIRESYEAHLKALRDQRARKAYVRKRYYAGGIKKQIASQRNPECLKKWLGMAASYDALKQFEENIF